MTEKSEVNERKLNIIELAWIGWIVPVGVMSGGALGGALAGLASAINFAIMQKKFNWVAKYLLTLIISFLAIVEYFVVVFAFNLGGFRTEFMEGYNSSISTPSN